MRCLERVRLPWWLRACSRPPRALASATRAPSPPSATAPACTSSSAPRSSTRRPSRALVTLRSTSAVCAPTHQRSSTRAPYLDPVRLSDGRIVVSDMYRLVFFDSLGRMLGTSGRRGDGPGEFQQIAKVCPLLGDSLRVISENDRRVLVWDRDGNHLRTFARAAPILMESCFPDGSLITPVVDAADDNTLRTGPARAFSLDSVEYQRIAADGSVRPSLGVHARSWLGGDVPYYVQVWYARGQLYVADARKYEVRTYDSTGHVLHSILRVTAPLAKPRESRPHREARADRYEGDRDESTARRDEVRVWKNSRGRPWLVVDSKLSGARLVDGL